MERLSKEELGEITQHLSRAELDVFIKVFDETFRDYLYLKHYRQIDHQMNQITGYEMEEIDKKIVRHQNYIKKCLDDWVVSASESEITVAKEVYNYFTKVFALYFDHTHVRSIIFQVLDDVLNDNESDLHQITKEMIQEKLDGDLDMLQAQRYVQHGFRLCLPRNENKALLNGVFFPFRFRDFE